MFTPEMIDVNKYESIGAGTNSEVFAIDKDWVLKHSHDETDGFRVIANLNDNFIEKFSLPRIDHQRSDHENGIFVIERLVRVPYDLWVGTCNVHTVMNDLHHCNNPHTKMFNINKYLNNDHPLYDITLLAYRAWRILRRIGYPVSLDLNPGNIMMRKSDNKLILSDPFGHLDI